MSVNKVMLIGNVGKKPEIRSTQDGREVATISLATTESWKDKNGEKKEKTEWHRIIIFSPYLVGIIKSFVDKGTKLYVEGSLQTRKWTDKAAVDHYSTEVVLQGFNSSLQILGSFKDMDNKTDSELQKSCKGLADELSAKEEMDNDEIPF